MRFIGCLIISAAITGEALAEALPVNGEAIPSLVAGNEVVLHAPMGFRIPVRYSKNGRMKGEAGTLAFYLGAGKDTGRWWVKRNQLCHRWKVWFDGEVHCLALKLRGKQVFWRRNDGKTGTATLVTRRKPAIDQPRMALGVPASVPTNIAQPAPIMRKPERAISPSKNEFSGLASIDGIKVINKPAVTAAPAAQAAAPVIVYARTYRVIGVAANDILNVRAGPDGDTAKVGALAPDARGIILKGGCERSWCPIEAGGQSGWVHSRFLRLESQASPRYGATAEAARGTSPELVTKPRLVQR